MLLRGATVVLVFPCVTHYFSPSVNLLGSITSTEKYDALQNVVNEVVGLLGCFKKIS